MGTRDGLTRPWGRVVRLAQYMDLGSPGGCNAALIPDSQLWTSIRLTLFPLISCVHGWNSACVCLHFPSCNTGDIYMIGKELLTS
jgi:hypothetical protein